MDSVKATIQKIGVLKEKIDYLNSQGHHTDHLEKQKYNLQRQVKEEILNKQYKRFNKGGAQGK